MYGCFMAGICVNFVLMIVSPLVIRTRWWSLAFSILGGLAAVVVAIAAVIATVISIAAKVALTAQDQLNIRCNIGIKMFVFMWIAAVLTILAFLLHAALGCCCRPQRGHRHETTHSPETEKSRGILPSFARQRKGRTAS